MEGRVLQNQVIAGLRENREKEKKGRKEGKKDTVHVLVYRL